VKRRLLGVAVVIVVVAAVYELVLRDSSVEPRLRLARSVATIGSGSAAVGVGKDGTVLAWLPAARVEGLPELPLSTPPSKPRLVGTLLQQVRVLGAAPPELLAHVEKSFYGESGVDVVLRSGIELRFGDASQAGRKWEAAAAVLASSSTTALDYVDLNAPSRPAVFGSGHSLPPAP
jgi:hypothetical protein